MPTCPECREHYPAAGGGHCRGGAYGGCCRTFSGDEAFDRHRAGPYAGRRCIDVAATDGWREAARGWTNRPEMPRAAVPAWHRSDEPGSRVPEVPPGPPDASESDSAA